jgi:hypothetical protein
MKAALNTRPFARFFGILASLALSVLLAALSRLWIAAVSPQGMGESDGYVVMWVMALGLALAAVLLLLMIGISIYLGRKDMARKPLLLWMWLPVLAAAAVYPVHAVITRAG